LNFQDSWIPYVGSVGGMVLIAFGVASLVKRDGISTEQETKVSQFGRIRYLVKGIMINVFNPIMWFFWLTIAGTIQLNFASAHERLSFFAATLTTVLLTDILKAALASRLREILTARFINLFNKVVGIALLLFGLRVISYSLGIA